jgi:ATP-dependent DNA helicase RecG
MSLSLEELPGVGAKRIGVLRAHGICNQADLLRYIPRHYQDRTQICPIAQLQEHDEALVYGRITQSRLIHGRSSRCAITLQDNSGELTLVFFHMLETWQRRLKVGLSIAAFGKIQFFNGLQIVHPDIEIPTAGQPYTGEIVPIYPLTEDMRQARMEQHFFRKLIKPLLTKPIVQKTFPEQSIPACIAESLHLVSELDNLKKLHNPQTMQEVQEAQEQLKLQELLPFSLRMQQRRSKLLQQGTCHCTTTQTMQRCVAKLPFSLTPGQRTCLDQIIDGLKAPHQFQGLLQGDVGSGKTVLALLALISVIESGYQCVLLAPTDILARQHWEYIQPILKFYNMHGAFLSGEVTGSSRSDILQGLYQGIIQCAIGTHAVFSQDVKYHNLGFIIIDEQHRFGVAQREQLIQKGLHPDVLVMSATPIPRSLTMTLYGDLQPILLQEKPPGRKEIKTRIVPNAKREDLKKYLLQEVQNGNQAYWIVPRVADTDDFLKSIDSVLNELCGFSAEWHVASVHGKLPEAERHDTLNAFSKGSIQLLVATTVVEVGVNVPNANIMIIEHPERFGMAQLHQLRGRIGRSDTQAWCFLFVDTDNPAMERLTAFAGTTDGFAIAELDLQTRGAGNLEGYEQSGMSVFRYFDLLKDQKLIEKTTAFATQILGGEFWSSPEEQADVFAWFTDPETPEHGVH